MTAILNVEFKYDGIHRLASADRGDLTGTPPTGVNNPTFKQAWKDSSGNLTLESLGDWRHFREASTGGTWDLDQDRTHNAVNEITGITGGGWPTPAYDAAGNMTSGPKGDEPTVKLHFKWDAWNRQVAVFNDNNGSPGTTRAEYQYDGRNYRIVKLIPNGENWDRTDYYYNESWQALEERFASNQASKDTVATASKVQWLWDIRYIDAPVLRWRDDNDDSDFADPGETLYYCNDANMNVTALVDGTTGGAVERYVYDPYGKPTIYNADWSNTVAWANSRKNEILYCGYRYDPESGLNYSRARLCHTTCGWIGRDPAGYGDGGNLYQYVSTSPLDSMDPTGEAQLHHWFPRSIWQRVVSNPAVRALFEETVSAPWHYGMTGHGDYIPAVRDAWTTFLRNRGIADASRVTISEALEFMDILKRSTERRIDGFLRRIGVRAYSGSAGALESGIGTAAAGAFLYAVNAAIVIYVGTQVGDAAVSMVSRWAGCCECTMQEQYAQKTYFRAYGVTTQLWSPGNGGEATNCARATEGERQGLYAYSDQRGFLGRLFGTAPDYSWVNCGER